MIIERGIASESPIDYLNHPLQSFQLLRRMRRQWVGFQHLIRLNANINGKTGVQCIRFEVGSDITDAICVRVGVFLSRAWVYTLQGWVSFDRAWTPSKMSVEVTANSKSYRLILIHFFMSSDKHDLKLKGCRMGRSDKVSLWYVSLLINTRFRFFILK